MKCVFRKLLGSICLGVLVSTLGTQAQTDTFLDLGKDIPGESLAQGHAGQADVLSWSMGLTNSSTTHPTNGAGGAGRVNFQDLRLTKWVDKSSPKLMLLCASGGHISQVILTVVKPRRDAAPYNFITITLTDVLVSSISTGTSAGAGQQTENLTLDFGKVKYEYTPLKADGTLDTIGLMGWDIRANLPTK